MAHAAISTITCRPGSAGLRSRVDQRPSVASSVTGVATVTGVPRSSVSLMVTVTGVRPSAMPPPEGISIAMRPSLSGATTRTVSEPRALPN